METVTVEARSVWLSPDGKFYNGDAHENRAKEILSEFYNIEEPYSASIELEKLGWIRLTSNLLWDIRIKEGYLSDKTLTSEQTESLHEWCEYHQKTIPY